MVSKMQITTKHVVKHYINIILIWVLACCVTTIKGASVVMTSQNFDTLVADNELVFINFYADWCRFSQLLAPIFDEASDKIYKEFPQAGRVLFGKVDCEQETNLAQRFRISKYPTLKLIRHGKLTKREYRGQRSADAIVDYISNLLKDPVVEVKKDELESTVDEDKRALVAQVKEKEGLVYNTFRKIAMDLREDCNFYVSVVKDDPTTDQKIIFKPSKEKLGLFDVEYKGDLLSYDELSSWATEKCIPLVREITFENAEELTEEGLPFLILFHHPDDKESIEIFNREVQNQLLSERNSVNFLTADGIQFSHPLHHLGKKKKDLPLIAIDSFRHMYLFPNFNDILIPGKLKQFIEDLHSGKLHREFHYGPETVPQTQPGTTPPASSFKKLAPSRNRYTILRDEL